MSDAESQPKPSRRWALAALAVAFNAVAAALAGVPLVGYLLAPLLKPRADAWIDLGPTSQFPTNQTRRVEYLNPGTLPWDGDAAKAAAYVRRLSEDKFQIFAVNCTHLGCPVAWFPESGLFMCPCHGGVYYEDGQRASGPPPRGLYEYPYRLENDRLLVRGGHLPTLQDPM